MEEPIQLIAFHGGTGKFKRILKYTSLDWSDSINEDGDLSATIVGADVNPTTDINPYGTILAAVQGERIFHAGYVKQHSYSVKDDTYSVSCGGFLSVLEKRLVINKHLNQYTPRYWNTTVVIDEDNPPGEWILHAEGSYSDLVAALIKETIAQAGGLPIRTASSEGGEHVRNWKCWDLATVAQRIQDICDLEDSVEVRFDPHIEDGKLYFQQRTASELAENTWYFVADAQGSHVELADRDTDGSTLCHQCYATGGRDEDKLLTALSFGSLPHSDYPTLQIADTSHSSVSEKGTLMSYTAAKVSLGNRLPTTTGLDVPLSYECKVGDYVELGHRDKMYHYKLTDISGSADNGLQTLSLQERV